MKDFWNVKQLPPSLGQLHVEVVVTERVGRVQASGHRFHIAQAEARAKCQGERLPGTARCEDEHGGFF